MVVNKVFTIQSEFEGPIGLYP